MTEKIFNSISHINTVVNGFIWPPVVFLLIVTGLFLSIKTGFIQLTKLRHILKNTVLSAFRKSRGAGGGNLSPFQAMTTALAGTIGTGNISGVTGAIFLGGPGAVFWMWVSAFLGMCTKFCEIALAVRFRKTGESGEYSGGPMYYIENGLGRSYKWLAAAFALFGGMASFGIGNIAQSSEISGVMRSMFGTEPIITGLLLCAISAVVLFGGVKCVGRVTAFLVPLMTGLYLLAGFAVIILRLGEIPGVFVQIFKCAFAVRPIVGGAFGWSISAAVRQGFARGIFSNEAGLGSAPIAHAASNAREPCEQAAWGVFEVFVSTFVVCTITAIAVISSGILNGGAGIAGYASTGCAASAAFNAILPGDIGGTLVRISLLFFALSSIIGWSYYGNGCWGYIFGSNSFALDIYKLLFALACIPAACGSGHLMWEISDTLNALMALPNLTALLLLSPTAAKLSREYFMRRQNADV